MRLEGGNYVRLSAGKGEVRKMKEWAMDRKSKETSVGRP